MERIVVKVGSNVLTRENGTIDVTRVSSIVDQIAQLRGEGKEIILVTSGAVACGRGVLGPEEDLSNVEQRQVYSAVGQVRLMDLYYTLFHNYNVSIGQVLTMKENFTQGKEYSNQKGCMEAMLRSGVVPIVNENDTVCVTELMFTDNDELSSLVASMMDASTLIILSNIDGLYDGDPSDPSSKVISRVKCGEDISKYISSKKSSAGRGGMQSKSNIAAMTAAQGRRVIIANGRKEGILCDLCHCPEKVVHTEFVPNE